MDQRPCGVLKGPHVRLAGAATIGPSAGAAVAGGGARVSARIVDQQPGLAVVEIVCDCGARIHLQCTYAEAPAGAAG